MATLKELEKTVPRSIKLLKNKGLDPTPRHRQAGGNALGVDDASSARTKC